jgi:hypothetical protein
VAWPFPHDDVMESPTITISRFVFNFHRRLKQ